MQTHWETLYRMQDWAIKAMGAAKHGFHLTGGTALSRGYCNHRYSEDLDLFVNDRDEFELWRDRCLHELSSQCRARAGLSLDVVLREKRFGRAIVHGEADLKLEFVDDVPSRVGEPVRHPSLGLLDTEENILANKITALIDREEGKDLADIFWLCCRRGLSLESALNAAEGKAAGVFPPLVAKRLEAGALRGLPDVQWINPPTEEEFVSGLRLLADSLVSL